MTKFNVLLCCGAGMSSGFLAQRTQKAAEKKGLDFGIDAKSQSVVEDVIEDYDVLMLGPHYESHIEEFIEIAEPYGIPVKVIPKDIYGTLDGEGLVNIIFNLYQKQV